MTLDNNPGMYVYIECRNCAAKTAVYPTREEAIVNWNSRYDVKENEQNLIILKLRLKEINLNMGDHIASHESAIRSYKRRIHSVESMIKKLE